MRTNSPLVVSFCRVAQGQLVFSVFLAIDYRRRPSIPHNPNHLQVTIDELYGCAVIVFEFRAANSHRPPGSPPNSFKIIGPHEVPFSPTDRPCKSFSCNTYEFPRKCYRQKTYHGANSFSCNTYKKQGGGARAHGSIRLSLTSPHAGYLPSRSEPTRFAEGSQRQPQAEL